MDLKSFKCPECDHFDELDGLRRHCSRSHGTNAESLYRALFMNGKDPSCECGCGQIITKFWGIEKGYSKFVRGHHSRVHNNWGHNKVALQKSQDVRRQQIAGGEWVAWNKNQTKETDERVAAYGQTQAKNFTQERREIRSERMTANRLNKIVPDLKGKEHGMWRGGSSALQPLARARLHSVWTYPKLKAANFTCQGTGPHRGTLEVHHDQERFAAILQKAIAIFGEVDPNSLDGDFERKSSISEWVADYHIDNNVSGIVLCEACHLAEHSTE